MKISLIIPTFNEKKIIRECLDRLLRQSRKADEIIFVDESRDGTPQIISEYAKNDDSIRLFHFDEKKGVSFSKNFGAKKSIGDIICFMDADMFADTNLVEQIESSFKQKNVIMAGWKDTGVQPKTFIAKCYYVRARYYGETRKDVKQAYAPRCYRREVFEKFGGFNEKMKYFEDVDLGERIAKSGLGVLRRSANEAALSGNGIAIVNAFVAHVDPSSFEEFEKQNAWLGNSLSVGMLWERRRILAKPLGPLYWLAFFAFFLLGFVHVVFWYAFAALCASLLLEFVRCVRKTGMLLPSAGFIVLSALKVFITGFSYLKKTLCA